MKIASSILCALIVLMICCLQFGCVIGHRSITTFGNPLDQGKISLIKPGATTLGEILTWFGPPDFIIDGSQRIVDTQSLIAGYSAKPNQYPIPTRTLASPEGMVILIYIHKKIEAVGKTFSLIHTSAIYKGKAIMHSKELFIFLSKKDLTVVEIVFQ